MKEAVIVSTARTPIGKAYRGGFNNLQAPTMGAHAIRAAVERAGIEGDRVEDCIMGAALTQGTSGMNIGRNASLRAGLPVTVSGMTIDRQCSSGLMAVATAAKQVMHDGMDCVVGGGLDSISLVQNEHMNGHRLVDNELVGMHKDIYMPMLQTAEVVAARYGISRDAMDEYGFASFYQRRWKAYWVTSILATAWFVAGAALGQDAPPEAESQNQLVGLIGLVLLAVVTATEAGLAVKRVRNAA